MRVSMTLLTLILLQACSSQPPVVTQTELVEVEVCTGYIPIPADLTKSIEKQDIEVGITYRELIQLLMIDRANLEIVNGRLDAIRELSDDGQ